MSPISRHQTQSAAKSLISESMFVEILCTKRTIMDQERSLVGHLTKLEPTPTFRRLQQLVVFYSKERNLSTRVFFANVITK